MSHSILMDLQDDFKSVCGSILLHNPLPNVYSVVSWSLAEEVKFKYHNNMISNKIILYTTPSVFVVPIYKRKYQGRIGLGNDECLFQGECSLETLVSQIIESKKKNFQSQSSKVVIIAYTTIDFGSYYAYPFKATSQISNIA